ncbi:MAG: DNA polymerase III subunit alpha [Lachnospiraceae bacterium]|nr:DNA polymerase III subunit alpha [Lachnospiraceae bacterium]
MAFAHLHVHTEYSLLDGSNKITEYVARVKELGMGSAAITDHGAMFGVIDFYKEAKAQGIKPILGCEVYVAPNSRFDKETTGGEDRYYHLVLLAENNQGYQNLMKIVSIGYTEGFYYKPRVDREVLARYHEGIIATSACLAGEVQRYIEKDQYEEACAAAKRYENIFGKGNFFLELQNHGIPEQKMVNQGLLRMSRELGIELVVTNDVHYTYAEDEKPHDILLCLQTGKRLADEDRMRYEGGQYFVKSQEEMAELFRYAPQALENTQKIADRCNVEIEFGVTKLPQYDVPEGYTSWEYLNKLCSEGFAKRYPDDDGTLRKQLDYELSIIQTMGYVDYFLIVWDFIKFARDNGIAVGPGRGSAAGSLVSYSLGITNIDPARYQLLFERFLNPERVSMPDIDVDFCFERRQEVIDYVVRKYGKDRVAQIVTFGTLAARAVLKDVGRVMDMPYAFVDSIAKMVPRELNITLDRALQVNPELRNLYETNEQVKELVDMSKRLEGLPRHASTHAAGIVISQKSVDEYVPLSRAQDGSVTTQFTMTTLEELGLLKMDFLGLRTLTVIQNAVEMAEKSSGTKIDIDRIDYQDQKVLDSLGTGKTDGVFQLESAGMKSFMKELKPQSLEDLIAGISLYRPGPMQFIPQYIRGKNHPDQVTYDCPELEPILKPTYGCIVYQEQVMQIVQQLAGYTLGRADLMRRAMSKKKASVMQKERQSFVYGNEEEGVPGCIARGIPEAVANKIYDEMMDFAEYAFNKSHAAAYAVVSYQTAWLKYYYPVEYMAALLTSVIDNSTKVSEYIASCRQMSIRILPPDINESIGVFSVSNGAIRYGLTAIKSVGKPVIAEIIREREEHGLYQDLEDFIERTAGKELNKRAIENFIKAGAFDSFPLNRRQMVSVYEQIMDEAARKKKTEFAGQMSLFDFAPEEDKASFKVRVPRVPEYGKEELLAFEKEVLGFYISGHPMEEYEEQWRRKISHVSTDFLPPEDDEDERLRDGERAVIGGMITSRTVKATKNNKMMAFINVEDMAGSVEVIAFPRDYEKYGRQLNVDSMVFVSGRVSAELDKASKLILENITPFEKPRKELWVQFADMEEYGAREPELFRLLTDSDGDDTVVVYVRKERQKKILPASRNVKADEALLDRLYARFGEKNVKLIEKPVEKKAQMH